MNFGLSFDNIMSMEQSDFDDWLAASKAMNIDKKLADMNTAIYGQPCDKKGINAKTNEWNKLKSEQLIHLGDDPFRPDEELIKKTKEHVRKQGKIRRIFGGNKGNTGNPKA
jgi:hypothetical protein